MKYLVGIPLLLISLFTQGQIKHYDPIAVHALKGTIVRSFAVSEFNPNEIYAGVKGKAGEAFIYKSGDNGTTWEVLNGGKSLCHDCEDVQAICATDPNTIVVGTWKNGLFISKDKGKSFKEVKDFPAKDIRSIILTGSGFVYAATTTNGILKSEDKGKSWKVVHDESLNPILSSWKLRTYPGSKNIIYAMTFNNGVYRTIDGGETWKEMMKEKDVMIWDIGFFENEEFAIASNDSISYLFESFLGDNKWKKHKLNCPSAITSMEIVKTFKGYFFLFGTINSGIYKSYAIEEGVNGYRCIDLEKDDSTGVAQVYSNNKRLYNFSWGDGIKIIDREEECEVNMQAFLYKSKISEEIWGVTSNCELDYFYFRLYDKWGELIYEKEGDIKEVNTELRTKIENLKLETHIYWIKFSFANDEKTLDLKGHVEIKE